jgi:phosphoribosylamine-glycine ligase
MRFLILSESADGLGFATRLLAEGHEVRMWIRDGAYSSIGDGLVERAEGLFPGAVVVADVTGFGVFCDQFRWDGNLVYGGSSFADKLELDRAFATYVMSEARIKTPDSESFTNLDDAIELVKSLAKREARLVFKPSGDASGNIPSYVSEGKDDLIDYMEHARMAFVPGSEFVLQEHIEGTDISTEAIFARDHFVRPFNHTIEKKAVLDGDLGASAGCAGNIIWCCEDEGCPVCKETSKLEKVLAEHDFVGGCDLNTIIEKESGACYGLEFTPRFGYDASPTLFYCCFDGNLGEFFYKCATGACEDFPAQYGYGTGIRISIPPYPHEGAAAEGLEIGGLRKNDFTRFYPYGVALRDGKLVTAGSAGNVGVALGFDKSLARSWDEAYGVADRLKLQAKQYRMDLAEVTTKHLHKVERLLVGA